VCVEFVTHLYMEFVTCSYIKCLTNWTQSACRGMDAVCGSFVCRVRDSFVRGVRDSFIYEVPHKVDPIFVS